MENMIFIKIWPAGAPLHTSGAKKGYCRKKRFKSSSVVVAPFALFDSQIYRNNICIHAGCLLVMSIT